MNLDYLHHSWTQNAKTLKLNANIVEDVWQKLIIKYSETHRYYHNLNHIESMLRLSDSIKLSWENKPIADLAIWFHDVIYDPKSFTNERDSSDFFNTLDLHLDKTSCQLVTDYIKCTSRNIYIGTGVNSTDCKLLMDIDFSILGSDTQEYFSYVYNIKKEFLSCYSELRYVEGRLKFISSLLESITTPLFLTDYFKLLYYDQAYYNLRHEKYNLERYLIKLKQNENI